MISDSVLFKDPNPNNHGMFVMMKCVYLGEDGNHYSMPYKCDGVAYFPMLLVNNTPYEDGQPDLGRTFKPENMLVFEVILDMAPDIYLVYIELYEEINGEMVKAPRLELPESNSHMRLGKSLVQLLRNMREWAYVAETCDEQHPMATYSKRFFELVDPPQEILDELDSLPPMHLCKFFNGDPNFFPQPESYPNLSENAKEWFRGLQTKYRYMSAAERIMALDIPE